MKSRVIALVAGLLIGGAILGGPLTATASENANLRQRMASLEEQVSKLKWRFDTVCSQLAVGRGDLFIHLRIRGVC